MALRDKIKRHLKLLHGYVMEYKPHDASLRDNSSYRNTWLRGQRRSRDGVGCGLLLGCL
ncbi:hypothetical protein Hanom_Chr07g00628911 [Helianthus anomalus]